MPDKKQLFDAMIDNVKEYANENGLSIFIVADCSKGDDITTSILVGKHCKLVSMVASAIVGDINVGAVVQESMVAALSHKLTGG